MGRNLENAIHGAVAGAVAASTMTVLRMAARKLGLIDTMVPQAVEQLARAKSGVRADNPAAYTAADQAIHLGYGAAWGALFGLAAANQQGRRAPLAVGLAVAQWLVGPMAILPGLRIAPPPWRQAPKEVLVNVAAHGVYAVVTAALSEQFAQQIDDPRRRVPQLRLLAKVG